MANFWKTLPKPFLVLAPMEDVTDVVFRQIVNSIARPHVFFTEFTSAEALVSRGHKNVVEKLSLREEERPIVAQIWGTDLGALEKAAKIVQDLGFDGIDINMGCPVPAVFKKGAGSALIANPDLTNEIIEAVRTGAPNLPLSVKTRIGIGKITTTEWISFLLEQKLDALTIHARTSKQMSKGEANWEEIALGVKLRDKISPETLLIGNGDIKSYKRAIEMHETFGVDGIMVGRGIFSNPWIFDEKKSEEPHTKKEYLNILEKHLDLFEKTWEDKKNFHIMKKFFKMYIKDFSGANELRQKMMECNNPQEVKQLL